MKRLSLQQKLREIAKVGTLRTYTRDEAYTFFREGFPGKDQESIQAAQEMVHTTRNAYDRGLILCSYTAYEKTDMGTREVNQFTPSLADFVLDVVWYMIK